MLLTTAVFSHLGLTTAAKLSGDSLARAYYVHARFDGLRCRLDNLGAPTRASPAAGAIVNFLEDLAFLAATDLMSRGVPFRKKWLDRPLFFYAQYLEFLERRIEPCPRRVLVSDTLRSSGKWSAHQHRLDELTKASERGDDLSHYQTKDVDAFGTPDFLPSDWAIHHLHLGAQRGVSHPDVNRCCRSAQP